MTVYCLTGIIQYHGQFGTKEVLFIFSQVNDSNILVKGIQVGFESDTKLEKASKMWEITEMGGIGSIYNMDGEIADDVSDWRQKIADNAITKKSKR